MELLIHSSDSHLIDMLSGLECLFMLFIEGMVLV